MEHSSSMCLALALAMAAAATVAVTPCVAQTNSAQDFVNPHNAARAAVGVGPMSWGENVATFARRYAAQRQGDCKLEHSSGGPNQYGENLFWGGDSGWTASEAVSLWVGEKPNYDYNSNTCAAGKVCGHYTQVVWRKSTAIGCACVVCNNGGGVFITCNYNPPGHFAGEKPPEHICPLDPVGKEL